MVGLNNENNNTKGNTMHHVTIIQQGTSPKVVEAMGTLRSTLNGEGIDTDSFAILRGGAPADLDASIIGDMTVTATKKSVGA